MFESVTALRNEKVGTSGADAGELTRGTHEDDLEEPRTGTSHFSGFGPEQKGDRHGAA